MLEHVIAALREAETSLQRLLDNKVTLDQVADAGEALAASLRKGGRVFSCGNGGSMCDAMHFAEELSGRFRKDRAPLPATAISDPAHLSCTGNDFGYEHVFSRYIEAHARSGDVLLAISTSGTSPNVVNAAEVARRKKMKIITLTGKAGSKLGALADFDIATPGGNYSDRVQELHIKIIHTLIELVERQLFPECYK